jgi:hypothetical protein
MGCPILASTGKLSPHKVWIGYLKAFIMQVLGMWREEESTFTREDATATIA